ncbi:MAG: hypothetical protein WCR61_05510 [Bacteroidales bacterium]
MKTKITLLLLTATLFYSCQKTALEEVPTWNALAFTESQSNDYLDYMNEPHINISFPSKTDRKTIIYERGEWREKNSIYILTAHNWKESEVILHIYKGDKLFNEFILKPEVSSNNNKQASLKEFSLSFQPTPGEYSFKASVKDSRGITLLNLYTLHGSKNKMIVY